MKALIKNGKSNYTSHILAISNDNHFFDKKIIVFSPDYKSIKSISLYKKVKMRNLKAYNLHNRVFIFDYNSSEFIENKGWSVLPCILEKEELLQKIEKNKNVEVCEVNELKQYADEVEIPKFYEVNTDADLKNLEMISSGFHDATLEKANCQGNNLFLTFDCMFCKINLQFIDIIEENLVGKVYEIYDSEFRLEDNVYRWDINDAMEGWTDGTDCSFIKGLYLECKKIYWNFEFQFD